MACADGSALATSIWLFALSPLPSVGVFRPAHSNMIRLCACALLLALPAAAQQLTSADYMKLAAEHLQSGDAQAAVDEYSHSIRLRLDNDEAWTGRGRAYIQLARYSA